MKTTKWFMNTTSLDPEITTQKCLHVDNIMAMERYQEARVFAGVYHYWSYQTPE